MTSTTLPQTARQEFFLTADERAVLDGLDDMASTAVASAAFKRIAKVIPGFSFESYAQGQHENETRPIEERFVNLYAGMLQAPIELNDWAYEYDAILAGLN